MSAPSEQYDAATVRTIELDWRRVPAGNPDAAGVSHYIPAGETLTVSVGEEESK